MIKLPARYSKKWLVPLAVLFLLTFAALFTVSKLLGLALAFDNYSGFFLLSLLTATAISLGGFLGARVYFGIAAAFDILGIAYMLYVTISRSAEGWSDLVSIISYMMAVAAGLLLGIVVQLIVYLVRRKRRLP